MRFRSLGRDGADEGQQESGVPDADARRFHATFDCPNADAPGSDARFDGTDANPPRSNYEFSLGPSTL